LQETFWLAKKFVCIEAFLVGLPVYRSSGVVLILRDSGQMQTEREIVRE
jgi:hypothetical protein